MEKKEINWGALGFSYTPIDWRYVAEYKQGSWGEGRLSDDPNVTMNECACVLQYCQEVFEGLKAYTAKDGSIVTFRPDLNAKRMADSARRLEMPAFPEERFLSALDEFVRANAAWVPPYGSGASLYVRPYMYASGPMVAVAPAEEYVFRMIGMPVGPYFKNGIRPLSIRVCDYDRAAPRGTGNIKAGLNYAMSMYAQVEAHREGYDENMYPDPETRSFVEETGGANFLFVTKEGELVTPKSGSILPSVTRRSLMYVAEHYLGMKVTERSVRLEELGDFAECGVCGTAAVICPVGRVVDHGKEIRFPTGMEQPGPITLKLYQTLTGIQMGDIEPPAGWIRKIL